MRFNRIAFSVLLPLVMINAGCAGLDGGMPRFMLFSEQDRILTEARAQLRLGNEQKTRDLLEKVVDGPPAAGISDEALFRLALLSLNGDGVKGVQRAQTLLEKLTAKYPESLWTRQSAPLLAHLAEARALRNRQRELKSPGFCQMSE